MFFLVTGSGFRISQSLSISSTWSLEDGLEVEVWAVREDWVMGWEGWVGKGELEVIFQFLA